MTSPLLSATGLAVSIGGHRICRDLDWQVAAGDVWAILGKNGAGKSTLLNTIAGLRGQDAGALNVGVHPLPGSGSGSEARALARMRGYLAQHQTDDHLAGLRPPQWRWD